MAEWPSGTKLSQDQATTILDSLVERYQDGDPSGEGDPMRRPKKLINRIMWNRAHFHNLEVADPQIPEPYHEGYKFQTDRPRQIWSQLKARLIENPYTVLATTLSGKSTSASDRLEQVLQVGLMETEYRTGQNIMGALADGMITMCYGVLHWRRAEEFYPHEMKREYSNQFKEGYEVTPLDDRELGTFREKNDVYYDRRKGERVRLGFPYAIEVLDPSTVFFLDDNSMESGAGVVAHIRKMRVIDYDDSLRKGDKIRLSVNEQDQSLRIYREQDAPPDNTPVRHTQEVVVVNLWTRDECYEFAVLGRGRANYTMAQWEFVKHFTHDWGMPPFVRAPGFEYQDHDPVYRYQSALEGIYRLKPGYDRLVSLWMIIAEMTAIPVWYLEDTATGIPRMTEDGRVQTFSRNAATSEKLPPGTTLKKMEWNIRPEFLTAIEMFAEELEKAEPSTGLASFSASTQPWTARLEQQQQSIQPKQLLMSIVRGMRVMVKSITQDIARRDEPVSVMTGINDTQTKKAEVVEVTPSEAAKLVAFVNVDSVSAAERYSKIEMGRQLRADPKVKLSFREFVEEYEGKQNASQVMEERDIDEFFEMYEKPALNQRLVNMRMSTNVAYNPQSQQFIGPDGGEMSPSQVMQTKSGTGAGTTGASSEGGFRNPGMPEMNDLQAPGTVQVEGMR